MKALLFLFIFLQCKVCIWSTSSAKKKDSVKDLSDACLTKGCLIAAGAILESVDYFHLPCVNFYNFVCRNYQEKTPLGDSAQKNLYSVRRDEYIAELNVILSNPKELQEPLSFRRAKDIFFTCMNSTTTEQVHALADFLDDLGGWPLMKGMKWKEDDFQWLSLTQEILKFGLFKAAAINPLRTDDTKVKFYLGLNLDSNKELIHLLGKRENFIQALVQHFGIPYGNVSSDIELILNFAEVVNEILRHKSDDRTTLTVSSLERKFSKVKWDVFLERLYGTSVDTNDFVMIYSLGNFKELVVLFETTNKRVLANWYMALTIVSMYSDNLFTPDFREVIMDDHEETSVVRHCVSFVSSLLPSTIKAMHERKYFHLSDRIQIKEMEAYIKLELNKFLQVVNFFTEEHTNNILKALKVDNIMDGIERYEENLREAISHETKKCLIVSRKYYLKNALLLSGERFHEHLDRTENNNEEKYSELSNESFRKGYPLFEIDYESDTSAIHLPASLRRGLFFSADRPKALNYGILGFSMAQEIFSKLDSREVLPEITSYKHCLEDQMNTEVFDGHTQQRQLATTEHTMNTIARDIWGIRIAYWAFRSAVNWTKPDTVLPGIKFSPNQLFWISYALSMCQVFDFDKLVSIQPQVLGRTRVLHVIPNTPEFSEDFGCPVDYRMNPKDRCTLINLN